MEELISHYKLARGGHCSTINVTIHFLHSVFFLFLYYILILVSGSLFFSVNPLFLIFSSLPHISTLHLYLTYIPSWNLYLFTSEESGRRSLFNCNLHCSGHFLINAVDKAVVHHLIRRQQVTPNWKLPLWSLILFLQILLPTWSASESFDSPFPLLDGIPPRHLSCDLHYSGHFLINAADKTVVHHLMWRQQATPN